MIARKGLLYTETVTERDNKRALYLAVNDYCNTLYSSLFLGGELREYVYACVLREATDALRAIEVDRNGRDSSGIDIDGALTALDYLKVIDE